MALISMESMIGADMVHTSLGTGRDPRILWAGPLTGIPLSEVVVRWSAPGQVSASCLRPPLISVQNDRFKQILLHPV